MKMKKQTMNTMKNNSRNNWINKNSEKLQFWMIWIMLLGFWMVLQSGAAHALPATVRNVRLWTSPESTRIVLDLDQKLEFHIETQKDPDRILIDLKQTTMNVDLTKLNLANSRIQSIKSQTMGEHQSRLILTLTRPLKPNAFLLLPNQQYGHRLVVDLDVSQSEKEEILALFEADSDALIQLNNMDSKPNTIESSNTIKAPKILENSKTMESSKALENSKALQKSKTIENSKSQALSIKNKSTKPFIVAIDPGHGGEDPGAIGRSGTREKDVVLAISKQLKKLIDQEPGMRGILIRSGDYYIGLSERVARARKHKADLFVSIHADAFHDKKAQGASVFTVSERGASSSAARWLADRENRSDLVGGLSLKNKHPELASVLLDLTQTHSRKEGLMAAQYILKSLGKLASLHRGQVEQAGFLVLKAPDIPSLLVETAFISHPPSESKLRSTSHQKRLAQAILEGIREFKRRNPRLNS